MPLCAVLDCAIREAICAQPISTPLPPQFHVKCEQGDKERLEVVETGTALTC